MKYINKMKHFGLLCLLSLTMVGCTDWDDHYNGGDQHVGADKTLWEEIESRPELDNFKRCLEQYGYKEILNSSQMFTVFAPEGPINTNGLSDEKVKTEVIENHIARFAHSANGAVGDKPDMVMLNTKAIRLEQYGDGYLFGEKAFTDEYNIRAKNGVLHVIEGQQMFFHNIWEYLTTDTSFTSVCEYLYSFNDTILDEERSIKGEINENGQQEYLDSVVYVYNSMFYSIGQLNNEDSTYTMLIPTNKAWKNAYERVKPYYKYPTNISSSKRDSLQRLYTGFGVVRDLVFSHTVQTSVEDSIISTTDGVFKNPFEYILTGYSDWDQSVKCSNGGVFVVDELKHNPWDSWHERIKVEAERSNSLNNELTTGAMTYRRTLPNSDSLYTKVSGGSYIEVMPSSTIAKPTIVFNVWNTLAGRYDVKVIFLPQKRATYKGTIKPNLFNVQYAALTNKGELSFKNLAFDCANDPTKIDTVTVGSVNLTNCAYGTDMIGLQVKLEALDTDKENSGKEYSTTYLIDGIILEPSKK